MPDRIFSIGLYDQRRHLQYFDIQVFWIRKFYNQTDDQTVRLRDQGISSVIPVRFQQK